MVVEVVILTDTVVLVSEFVSVVVEGVGDVTVTSAGVKVVVVVVTEVE